MLGEGKRGLVGELAAFVEFQLLDVSTPLLLTYCIAFPLARRNLGRKSVKPDIPA